MLKQLRSLARSSDHVIFFFLLHLESLLGVQWIWLPQLRRSLPPLQWQRKGKVRFYLLHFIDFFNQIKVTVSAETFVHFLKDTDCYIFFYLQLQPLSWTRIDAMWHVPRKTTASGLHQPHREMVLPQHCLFVKSF